MQQNKLDSKYLTSCHSNQDDQHCVNIYLAKPIFGSS